MSRPMDATQEARSERSWLSPVTLLKLTEYANRTTGLVGATFYFATRPVLYDYGNTGTNVEFEPFLLRIGELAGSTNQVASPRDDHFTKSLEIDLANDPYKGVRLSEALRSAYRLENAEVEISQIMLSPAQASSSTAKLDLSGMDGDEHTVLYRGVIATVVSIDDESISLLAQTRIPTMQWSRASDALTVERSDLGQRLPIPYGEAKRIRCVSADVGWFATLSEQIPNPTATGLVEVSDTSGFPQAGNFNVQVTREKMTVNVAGEGVLDVVTRGVLGTVASSHNRAEGVLEILDEAVWIAGVDASSVRDVYMTSPVNDELVKLRPGDYTVVPDDLTVPGHSGVAMASIRMTEGQISTIFSELFEDIEASETGSEFVEHEFTSALESSDNVNHLDLSPASGAPYTMVYNLNQGLSFWGYIPSSYSWGADSSTDEVSRFRFRFEFTGTATSSNSLSTKFLVVIAAGGGFPDSPGDDADDMKLTRDDSTYPTGLDWTGPFIVTSNWFSIQSPPATLADFQASGSFSVGSDPAFSLRIFGNHEATPGFPAGFGPGTDIDLNAFIEFELVNTSGAITTGSGFGFNLELFAEVDGPTVRSSSTTVYPNTIAYWMKSPATKIGNNASEWNMVTGSATPADDSSVQVDGQSVRFDVSSVGQDFEARTDAFISGQDWTAKVFQIRWRYDGTPSTSTTYEAELILYSGGATDAAHTWKLKHDIGGQFPTEQWHTFVVDLSDTPDSEGGSFDMTDVDRYGIRIASHVDEPDSIWFDQPQLGDAIDGSAYKATEGGLIEHPADVFRHFVEEVMGATVDEASVVAAQTDLGDNKLAGDLRSLGVTTEEILAQLGFYARGNVVLLESASGQEWGLLTANADYTYDAASGSITEWSPGEYVESSRDIEDLGTRFVAHYAPDFSLKDGDALYQKIVVANPVDGSDVPETTQGELITAESKVGRIDFQPLALPFVQDEVTAEDILGFYVHEAVRLPPIFTIGGVPWWEAYKLTEGDIVNTTPPWKTSAAKVRVLEYVKSFETEQAELRVIEVL